jgi:nucleotide-binding universal stress UspA family protein
VKVLVGVDGSVASVHALELVLRLLGPQVGHLEIATVVDYDAPTEDETLSKRILEAAASRAAAIAPCVPVTVGLVGRAGAALLDRARDGGFDLLAVGRRGRGMSKMVFGSVARTVADAGTVPVVIVGPDALSPGGDARVATDATTA